MGSEGAEEAGGEELITNAQCPMPIPNAFTRISHAFGWGGVGGAALHKALDMKRSVSIPPHSPHTPHTPHTPQFLACEKSRF
ncbi:MAG: hypothetical protein V7K67_20760 [Nostoc sp.]|uniref:hypothetical protein n=1 Tax=Nostoc sp. TaxID=1180 RepID=UPI002FFB33A1